MTSYAGKEPEDEEFALNGLVMHLEEETEGWQSVFDLTHREVAVGVLIFAARYWGHFLPGIKYHQTLIRFIELVEAKAKLGLVPDYPQKVPAKK